MEIRNEQRNRGVKDILIAVDGLSGFPDASMQFSMTRRSSCARLRRKRVLMVRNSVKYISYKGRKAVTADLKTIYLAPSADAASDSLEKSAEKWDGSNRRFAISCYFKVMAE
jgi:transposase-like protein